MSHIEQQDFFRLVFSQFPSHASGKVLDIGSYDINGGPHNFISPSEYVGVDLAAGPNVNLVQGGQDVDLPSNYFDLAMSSECFEHNPYWIATFQNMIRMTKPGGVVAFSSASTFRPVHGTSDSDDGYAAPAAVSVGQEFYRNVSKAALKKSFEKQQFSWFWIGRNLLIHDIYFVGIKHSPSFPDLSSRFLSHYFRKSHRSNLLRTARSYRGLIQILIFLGAGPVINLLGKAKQRVLAYKSR